VKGFFQIVDAFALVIVVLLIFLVEGQVDALGLVVGPVEVQHCHHCQYEKVVSVVVFVAFVAFV